MLRVAGFLVAAVIGITLWPSSLMADFTLVLKNGRRITVQSYREEGGMIKFHGLGGEIGIAKEQVQAILKAGERKQQGLSIPSLGAAAARSPEAIQPPSEKGATESKEVVSPEQALSEERALEEKEYRKRLREVTEKLDNARQRYYEATQGGGSGSNVSKEGFKAWAQDLASRIHDSQKAAGGESGVNPPFPNYTAKETELSQLRSEIDSLQTERDLLIQEMKQKNIPTEGP